MIETFDIVLKEPYYKRDDNIIPFPFKDYHWFWRMLGFSRVYDCKILSDPKQEGEFWTYKCKLNGIRTKWLKWTIKKQKME